MRKPTLGEILFAVAGIAIGWGAGAMPSAHALQETAALAKVKYFQVIDEDNGDKIRAELNAMVTANQTCEVVAIVSPAVASTAWRQTKVILECWR